MLFILMLCSIQFQQKISFQMDVKKQMNTHDEIVDEIIRRETLEHIDEFCVVSTSNFIH